MYLQEHLFSHGKYATVQANPNGAYEKFMELKNNDVLLITSMHLNYLQLNQNKIWRKRIKQLKCQKIVLTQMQNKNLCNLFDVVIPCGIHAHKDIQSYAIMRLYDLIIHRYHEKYQSQVFE